MAKETILGIKTDIVSLDEAVAKVAQHLENKNSRPFSVASVNPEIVMASLHNHHLKEHLNQADMAIPDGLGIVLASRLTRGAIRHRVTGIDMMESLLALAAKKSFKVFFLGGSPGVADEASLAAQKKYPGLQVAGAHHGYFPLSQGEMVAEKIAAAKCDMLFIGMGADRQEEFMFTYGKLTGAGLLMVVGGSFDVISARKKRAPSWIQRLGLEWFYRVLQEPRRALRILSLPRFVLLAILSSVGIYRVK